MSTTVDVDRAARRLQDYARLVLREGVNLQPGQELIVQASIDQAPFVRVIAEQAYAAGARFVDVVYGDPWLRRAQVLGAPEDALEHAPAWAAERLEAAARAHAPVIAIVSGSNADVFEGVDGERLARTRPRSTEKAWLDAVMGRQVAWTIVSYPTERWAREVFGEPDVERLWDAVAVAMRLDEPDPLQAWNARFGELEGRAALMTERRFDALHYRGPGTDLRVGLIAEARWLAAREQTIEGRSHAANLPTEEVFTSPHRLRAEGTIRSSMSLSLRGATIEGMELRLAGGEIVEAHATQGESFLRQELAADDAARRLGELALVDSSSRVARAGVVFHNTLLDENAASHIAWGSGIPWTLAHEPAERHDELGLNQSISHVDFMVGSPELEIDGVEAGGALVPILRGGEWQLR